MKVLHFFKTYWPDTFGGVERTIQAICEGTQASGISSKVLSLSADPVKNTQVFGTHLAQKAKLDFEFASTGFSREVFSRFKAMSAEADIVHYHFPWPVMDIVHLWTRHGKPSLVTYHSDIVKQRALSLLYRPVMNRFLGSVDSIVATSPNYVASSPVLKAFAPKVTAIPLGLAEQDLSGLEERRAFWAARLPKPFFLFVGVLRYYKGIHVLMEAAAKTGFDVVIVGDGGIGDALRRQATEQGLANLHFLGPVPDVDKMALLDLSLALAFPSHLRSEAFGLSLVEASMRGKPMISCEIGTGTSFVNLHQQTGIVIPPQDSDALSAAMRALVDNPDMARAYGANARIRYLENFTARRMADRYAALYRSLAGQD